MGKRAHIEFSDGLNDLPEELLVYILNFLTLKEAAATSILCRRWRYLWTFTNKLDLDGTDFYWRLWSRLYHFKYFGLDFLNEVWTNSEHLEESSNYIAWVNNILGFHKGSSIEEFRVDFLLYEAHKKHIDRWLRFASANKVQRLELNLRWRFEYIDYQSYTFPLDLFMNFKHLRTMRLQSVNVSGEGLEFLLGNSPFLEELSITSSKKHTPFKIIGPSLVLKRLEIVNCNFVAVEIHDINLEFFMYHGLMLQQFILKNVPIVEMHLREEILIHKDLLLMFLNYLPQLKKLTVDVSYTSFTNQEAYTSFTNQEAVIFYNNVKLSNLRHLVFKYCWTCKVMPLVTYLIRASPLLQSFVLEVYGGIKRKEMFYSQRQESLYFVNKPTVRMGSYEYPHLKRVEMIGYRGTLFELSLVVHLLENGSGLEQFIVDLRKRNNPQSIYNYYWPNNVNGGYPVGYPCEEHEVTAVKDHVKEQLLKRLPTTLKHLNLSIL